MTVGYAICFILAVALMVAYFIVVKKGEFWLGLLYVSVSVVNLGYFLLSISKSLEFAIFANDIAYLGSVFLSVCMFYMVLKLCGFEIKKVYVLVSVSLATIMFLIVATSGFLPWYYKSVDIEVVDGATKLVKEYGVLHPVYMFYLLGYFLTMIGVIVVTVVTKKVGNPKFAGLIAGVVCGNILVWLFERYLPWDFEFLSVTYIISEIMFLMLYWMIQDYVLIRDIQNFTYQEHKKLGIDVETIPIETKICRVLAYIREGEMLSQREREILQLILLNKRRKEIASELLLSENTIKTYTRSLYLKLGVSSREELYSLILKG